MCSFYFPDACHPYEPFKCPGDGNCISIQYLCDGAPDCSDGYDEDMRLCTAGKHRAQSYIQGYSVCGWMCIMEFCEMRAWVKMLFFNTMSD